MSTSNSPTNPSRLQKITGRRTRCSIYLSDEEVKSIDKIRSKTGLSRSSIIVQTYFKGKEIAEQELG